MLDWGGSERTKQMTESSGTSADSVSCMRRRIASASLMPVASASPDADASLETVLTGAFGVAYYAMLVLLCTVTTQDISGAFTEEVQRQMSAACSH